MYEDKNTEWLDAVWSAVLGKLYRTSVTCRHKLPRYAIDGVYDDHSDGAASVWTNGFWPGIMWQMYAATGEDTFYKTGKEGEELLDRALLHPERLHHDVGFMWLLSAGADYLLTKNDRAKERLLHAADLLVRQYNAEAGFIRAWNDEGFGGWVIIDSMMNIQLLFRASEMTGDPSYREIAMRHADKTIANHIRPDGSVYHILDYDLHTGECKGPAPRSQGFDPVSSSWTRGQAWGIYGFALSYLHTGEARYLDAAKRTAHYFIAAMGDSDDVPPSDFRAPAEPRLYDASAGAIAASGLFEIAKAVPDYEKEMYSAAALRLLRAVAGKHCDFSENDESIVQDTTGTYRTPETWNRSYIFGDYFFVEALCKARMSLVLFW